MKRAICRKPMWIIRPMDMRDFPRRFDDLDSQRGKPREVLFWFPPALLLYRNESSNFLKVKIPITINRLAHGKVYLNIDMAEMRKYVDVDPCVLRRIAESFKKLMELKRGASAKSSNHICD